MGSILSSNKDIEKLKPSFRLVNPHAYEYNYTFSSSFKDRIIRCLLALPGYRGDIAEICTKYGQIYYHQLENSGSADHKKVLSEIKVIILWFRQISRRPYKDTQMMEALLRRIDQRYCINIGGCSILKEFNNRKKKMR